MRIIDIEHLTHDYGGGRGVFDVSFEVSEGEAFGFLGPNGAGKTTTIRHLMGFLRPREGVCRIAGLDCWRDAAALQARIGYIPGEISFFSDMTGAGFLKFVAKYRGMADAGRTQELLTRFAFDPKGKIKKMSKGMKQKLGIVAALMHDPDILLFDEPTAGLDPLMQSRFIELVEEEKARGKTILMSSHMFDEVERTCHRIGILRAGRLVAVDTTQALRERHVRPYTVTLADEQTAAAFAKDFHGEQQGVQVTVTTKQTLEEIFMHFYGGDAEC